jgi:hypothetical protein
MKHKAIRISPWAPSDLSFGEMAAVTIGGLFMLVLGIWAFFAPASFAEIVAFPYNRHLLHDVGAFQIGIGTTMLLALMWTGGASWSCWPATLWVAAFTSSPTSSTGTSVATPTIRWC